MQNSVKWCWATVVVFLALPCLAHEPGLSSATFKVMTNGIDATLTFAVADVEGVLTMDNDLDGKVSKLEFAYAKTRLAILAIEALELSLNGSNLTAAEPNLLLDEKNNVDMEIFFPCLPSGVLKIRSKILTNMPSGHRQFATVENPKSRRLA